MEMQQESTQKTYPTLTSWLEDFLAKLSALQDFDEDLMTQEELSFLRSQGFSEIKDQGVFYLKTWKVYYFIPKEKPFRQYFKFLPRWVMTFRSRYIIPKTSESRKTEKGPILRDILEENVDSKYDLSPKRAKRVFNRELLILLILLETMEQQITERMML